VKVNIVRDKTAFNWPIMFLTCLTFLKKNTALNRNNRNKETNKYT